jgi:hypothetical protein
MNLRRRSVVLLLLTGFAGAAMGANDALSRHLAYLQHLEAAERFLQGGRPTPAIVELTKALDLRVPQSYIGQFHLRGSGATAHYLMACAHAMMGNAEHSLRELEEAFANGFTDRERALDDPCLAEIQGQPAFQRLSSKASAITRRDRYSGRTVPDESFGTGLILHRKNNFPKLGELAPEIVLERSDGSGSWTLSSYRGDKPVVLVFGSFT